MAQSGAAVGPPWVPVQPPALPPRSVSRPPPPPRPKTMSDATISSSAYVGSESNAATGPAFNKAAVGTGAGIIKKSATPWDSPSASSSPGSSAYFSYSSTSTSPPLSAGSPSTPFNPFRSTIHGAPNCVTGNKTPLNNNNSSATASGSANNNNQYSNLSGFSGELLLSDEEPPNQDQENQTSVIRRRDTVEVRSVAVQTPSTLMTAYEARATYPRAKGQCRGQEPRAFDNDDEQVFVLPPTKKISHSATICEWQTSFVGDDASPRKATEAAPALEKDPPAGSGGSSSRTESSPPEAEGKGDRGELEEIDRRERGGEEEEGCGVAKVSFAPKKTMSRAELCPAPQIAYTTTQSSATLPRARIPPNRCDIESDPRLRQNAVTHWLSELRSQLEGNEDEEGVTLEEKGGGGGGVCAKGIPMDGEVRECVGVRRRRGSGSEVSVYEDACSCCSAGGYCTIGGGPCGGRNAQEKACGGSGGRVRRGEEVERALGRTGSGERPSSKGGGGWKGIWGIDGEVAEGEGVAVRSGRVRGEGIEWRLSALGLAGKDEGEERRNRVSVKAGEGVNGCFRKTSEESNKACKDAELEEDRCKGKGDSVVGFSRGGVGEEGKDRNGIPRADENRLEAEGKGLDVETMIHACENTTAKVSHSDSFRSTSSESKLSSSSSSQEIPTASLSTEQLCGSGSSSPAGTIRPPVPPRRKRSPMPPKAESEKEDKGVGVMGGMRRNDLGEVDGCEDARVTTEMGKVKEEEEPVQVKATGRGSTGKTSVEDKSLGEKSPMQTSPVQRSPTNKSPLQKSPVEESPGQKSPVERSPVEHSPGEKSPIQTSPVQRSPTNKSPLQKSPVEESPVQKSPVERSPVENSPGEKSPIQTSPVQRSPTNKSPLQKSPVEESPVKKSPVERSPVEKSPVEKSPVEKSPVEKSPVEKSPVEKSPVEKSPVEKSPVEKSPVEKPPVKKSPAERSPVVKIPVQKSPVEKSPEQMSPVQKSPVEKSSGEKSPIQNSPVDKSPGEKSAVEKSPVQKSPTERTADFNSLDETSADFKSFGIKSFDSSSSFKSAVGDLGDAFKVDREKDTPLGKKLAKFSVGSEETGSSAADADRCESEISAESPRGEEEDDEIEDDEEDEEVEGGCDDGDVGEWKGVYVRGRRKGSYSSDIEAWKRGLTGWCSVEEEDEFLESTMFDPEDSQSLSVGCGSPLIDTEKSMEEWYSSNDAEGRVYFFEENSNESSWTLPEVSVTSPSQTPPPAGISGSPMGSDSFISGKSSGGEEAPGPNDHGDVEKEERSRFSLKGEPPMPKVKLMQSQWEKASGGRLIQLRDPANVDMDGRGSRNSRSAKTRSMVVVDSVAGEMKIPSTGKQTSAKDWPQLWEGNMCVLRQGTLNRTKITENGKRLRKNWVPSYVVLTELQLLFFKDAKSFASMKAGIGANSSTETAAIPELSVDLNGALVERDDRLSSRRNVFRVSTVLGLQVLCQDDNPQTFNAWFQDISKAAHHLPSGFDGSPRQNTLERQSFLDPHSPDEHKKLPRIGRSKSVKIKKDASMEDLSAASVTERQVKIKARLKKFFHRRPTMESLVKKGIWKDEPSFGCYLEQVSGEGIPRIPLFVQRCIAAIEDKPENMRADGLYRASGNLSQVQKIRLQVDQYNYEILDIEEDVHVLTGALKLFFRELKEPLIPFSLFNRALKASTNPNKKEQLNEFKELVKTLPLANYDTLKYLLKHLLRVTKYQESNRMHIANLAIVFGPTLMWPEQESLNMALDLMQQNLVIECLLQEFDTIFSSSGR